MARDLSRLNSSKVIWCRLVWRLRVVVIVHLPVISGFLI